MRASAKYAYNTGLILEQGGCLPDEMPAKELLSAKLEEYGKKLSEIQDKMYAHNRYAVLIVLQGMDASGKDGLVREVFKYFNPRGTVTYSFKKPSAKELQHDYLWRHTMALPERGKFGIFNRSYYENVLVTRVSPALLLNENLPGITSIKAIPKDFWEKRFEQIRNYELHLAQNGMLIFKFFLHISRSEQKKRLLARLNEQEKQWKFDVSDGEARQNWEAYMQYYQEAFEQTHCKHAPWYIIPSDNKPFARATVAEILWEQLKQHQDIRPPKITKAKMQQIEAFRKVLEAENDENS